MRKQDGTEIFEGVVGEVSPTGKGVYPKKILGSSTTSKRGRARTAEANDPRVRTTGGGRGRGRREDEDGEKGEKGKRERGKRTQEKVGVV